MSRTTYASGSTKTGVLSLAPIVSAARTAMPSIAEASNDGDDRVAQTGSAVTRPDGLVQAETRFVSTRAGQPAASQAARQAASASAAGTSRMNGVVAMRPASADPMCTGSRRPRSRPAGRWPRPVRRCSRRRRRAPTAEPRRRTGASATPSRTATWTMSRRPAADGTSRSRRAGMDGSAGGSVMPPTSRTTGTPTRRKTTRADRGFPATRSAGRRRSRRAASACRPDGDAVGPDPGRAQAGDGRRGLVAGADR